MYALNENSLAINQRSRSSVINKSDFTVACIRNYWRDWTMSNMENGQVQQQFFLWVWEFEQGVWGRKSTSGVQGQSPAHRCQVNVSTCLLNYIMCCCSRPTKLLRSRKCSVRLDVTLLHIIFITVSRVG